nr:PREDICTED: zinc finger protein 346-like [Bemisia tabaci]
MFDCEICRVKLNGEVIREAHLKGAKHQKKVKAAEMQSLAETDSSIKVEANNVYSCKVCDIVLNSHVQLKAHLDGSKHQTKVAQAGQPKMRTESGLQMTPISISATANPAPTPKTGPDGTSKAEFFCAHCNVHANSDLQYQQHMSSQKHLNKVNLAGREGARAGRGKPYNRSQFTNNGYSGPGNNGYSAPGNNGYSAPGNNGYNAPGNNGYSAPGKNSYGGPAKHAFRGKGQRNLQMGAMNGGYRFPYNYNGGYPRSRGGAHFYPAGYNPGNFIKGGSLPPMSTFFPKAGAV